MECFWSKLTSSQQHNKAINPETDKTENHHHDYQMPTFILAPSLLIRHKMYRPPYLTSLHSPPFLLIIHLLIHNHLPVCIYMCLLVLSEASYKSLFNNFPIIYSKALVKPCKTTTTTDEEQNNMSLTMTMIKIQRIFRVNWWFELAKITETRPHISHPVVLGKYVK